jgi:hypothetical protein
MPFCHLTQYCRSNTAVDIARILQVSTSPAGIKYKFGIHVPKGIKNAIDLDKKIETSYGKNPLTQSLSKLKTLSGIHSTRFRGGYSDRLSENSLPYGF